MGNAQSGSILNRTTGALDSFVAELASDVVYDKSLGSARFLKTVKCRHLNGPLVVKIYIKPDPGITLRSYHRRLKAERELLVDIPNVYGYQSFVETEKAGYIIRQWVASNLYDRISTRPFLDVIEKKWIAFQVITALRDARNRKVSHGDIKSENILVTSWNWVYLSDFATLKPTYLPLDDPSEFSYYFDTSGRRTCYVAPERFYTATSNPEISAKKSRLDEIDGRRDAKLTEAMDCFSVGCVIAELFLEGTPLFTLSQLFKYRTGDYSVDNVLNSIEDDGVRNMIIGMIKVDPSDRPSFDAILHISRGNVFPEAFYSFLHNYVGSMNEMPAESPFVTTLQPTVPTPAGTLQVAKTPADALAVNESPPNLLPSNSDQRIDKIWVDYESIHSCLGLEIKQIETVTPKEQSSIIAARPFTDVLPVELHIPNYRSKLEMQTTTEEGSSLIIVSLTTSNIRNCSIPSSKLKALDVLLALASTITDEAKLDRIAPYIIDLLHDDAAIVRATAFKTLMQILKMVSVVTPSNASIFPEYVIPNIKYLVQDPEISVRSTYAQCIGQLAESASVYMEMGQALRAHGTFKLATDGQEYDQVNFELSYDANLQDLRNNIQEHLSALLMDPSSVVKRAVLHDIPYLCVFLGVQKTNDVLLSHMITYLNDRDWLLRYAFFDSIVDVATCARGRSLEEYILPLMIQALSDIEETVVAKVLNSLTRLCDLEMFPKMRIWELMSATLGFLHHPNLWIRQGAASFMAAAAMQLPQSDVWCILYPSLRHYLRSDLVIIDRPSLLVGMKPPLSRQIFDAAVLWAMRSDKSAFWKGQRRSGTKPESSKEVILASRKAPLANVRNRSEEDDAQLTKLQQLGMTPSEEVKLLAMRDYVLKLALTSSSFAARTNPDPEGERLLRTVGDVELPKLGVVPRTVFLKSRILESTTRSSKLATRQPSLEMTRQPASPQRAGRSVLAESGTAAPFEDLRRRLATINASTLSVTVAPSGHRTITTPSPLSPLLTAGIPAVDPTQRPESPTDSVVSTANSSAFKPLSKLQSGSTENHKAAPAIGPSKTNVAGFLDSHPKLLSEASSELSGHTSSLSMPNTIRLNQQQRLSIPVSSYGVLISPRSTIPISNDEADGQEPGISNLLETLYLDNNRELQQDFGPRVKDGPIRRRNPARHNFASRDDRTKRMDASLVAHLSSHSDSITGLVLSPDHLFFVSTSDDKTVKVWDTARLERNVTSKPRHTYGQHHAKVKCVCMIEGSHCFASAAEDGSLHVVRVHVSTNGALPKYGKLQVIREYRVESVGEYITAMFHYNMETSSTLIYATTHGNIVTLNLRTMQLLQTMENPRHYGPVTCICVDRKHSWILVGTSTGVLTLWDRRFGLLLKSWYVNAASKGKSARIYHATIHPTKGHGKWVIVAVQSYISDVLSPAFTLVEVWDIERSILVETFNSLESGSEQEPRLPREIAGVDASSSQSISIASLVRNRQVEGKQARVAQMISPPSRNVRTVVVGVDLGVHSGTYRSDVESRIAQRRSGFMITGSEDKLIRLWDFARPERSCILSGLEQDRPVYSCVTNGTAMACTETWTPNNSSHLNRAPQRVSLIDHSQQSLLKTHHDVITSSISLDSPFRGGLITGDRAGVLKVWRIESLDQ